MIKIFGKIRYHWQPELSWSITYWSITLACIFISLSFLYEQRDIPTYFFSLFTIFVILLGLGFHRYFLIEGQYLKIVCLSPMKKSKLLISDITKVEVTKSNITIFSKETNRNIFYMRKLPKRYFVDNLVCHPQFNGEIELLDELINLDYFEKKDIL